MTEENTDLTTIGDMTGVMERPKSLGQDLTGTEGIGAEDVRLPRLAIAQGLSPQLIPTESSYIEALKNGDMFNDLTGEVYGRAPLAFVPVRRDMRRIEFLPRSEGGGVVDLDVPPGDPRLKWTTGPDKERIPPAATEFTEFVILLLRPGKTPEPIMLSIKSTNKYNRRAAQQLTTFIKLRNAAIYAGIYKVESKPEKNEKGVFGVYVVKNAGWIPKDTPAGAALFKHCENFAKSLEGKTIVVQREPGDDVDEFPGPEGEAAETPQM